MKKSGIPKKASTERSVPHDGFIIGSGSKPKTSKAALQKHDGIVIGGSVTSKAATPSKKGIDRLPGRQDGRIL